MMMKHSQILLLSLALVAPGCVKGPAFFKKGGDPEASIRSVRVAVTEQNGATTGSISSSSKATQVLSASANSAVAGSHIVFPPGSLAVDTDVTIQAGASLSGDAVLAQLNVTGGIASAAPAVSFVSSVATDAIVPFTVAIPLPDSSSLALTDPYANLVIIYHVNKASAGNADYTGIIGRGAIDTSTGFAKVAVNHFGTYQAVITKTLVAAVEIAAAPSTKVKKTYPPGTIVNRFYFSRGMLPVSYGNSAPQNASHAQGWVHAYSPAKVGSGSSTLSTGRISKALPDTP